jgi:hypothetical protein
MATKRSVGTLREADLKGKKVFIRVDLNVLLDGLLAAPRCSNVSTLIKFTYDEIKSATGGILQGQHYWPRRLWECVQGGA